MGSCSYIRCEDGIISNTDEFCEIKTVIPKFVQEVLNKSLKEKTSQITNERSRPFLLKWSKHGDARLHKNCWEIVLKLSRKRTKNSNKTDIMCEEEKVLIKEAAKTVEFFDSYETVKSEAQRVAEMIKNSKHCVCFTGAGISTSAGIGDYRGKSGKWTQQDQEHLSLAVDTMFASTSGQTSAKKIKTDEELDTEAEEEEGEDGVNYEDLRPTYTHEVLQKLLEMNLLKYIISQNGDGLHRLSQVPAEKISELHGNVFIEKCERCDHQYERSYYVMDDDSSQYYEDLEDYGSSDIKKPTHAKQCGLCGLNHRTGRKCVQKGCKGYLMDTIINFKDNLEDYIYNRAEYNASESDLMLCLGTTLLVSPANELVEMTKHPQKIVICNRQKTPLDYLYNKKKDSDIIHGSRVYGNCDEFMKEIMKHILDEEKLRSWESSRLDRLQEYHKLRMKLA